MFNPATSVPVDCSLIPMVRVAGVAALGLAVVALEAWLRVPVRPLLDGYLQEAHARVLGFVRQFSF
jgi:hypothetical protein